MSGAAQENERRIAVDTPAALTMIALTFFWGFNQVAVKVSNTGYDPIFLAMMRSAVASVLVFAWCRFRGIALFERDRTLVPGILAGVLFGAEFVLVYIAFDYTTVARGALMLNTMPFWVLIGGHFLLGERINASKLIGLVLAFAGVAVVFSDRLSLPDPMALRGDVLCLGAGIFWAATIIVIKSSRLSTARAEKTLLYQLSVSALFILPFLAFSGPLVREVSAVATGAFLFQAVFVVSFTYLLFFWMMTKYPASGLSSFVFLTPVFGVLCGGLILGEPLSLRIFLALALIGGGLAIVNRPVRRTNPA